MKKYLKENWLNFVMLFIALAINIFIIVNACFKGAKSSNISTSVGEAVINGINDIAGEDIISAPARPSFLAFFRKFGGHFCLFGLSGIFTSLTFYLFLKKSKLKNPFIIFGISLLVGFIIACVSEFIQVSVDGRFGSWKDVGIDSSGYLLGLIAVLIVAIIIKFSVKNTNKKQA